MTPTAPASKRRGRARKVESFIDWMARVDAEVDQAAREMERNPPTYASLHPAQRRIVELLIEHLRTRPEIGRRESEFNKPEYDIVNRLIANLFLEKYPWWENSKLLPSGCRDVDALPEDAAREYRWMLRNCASRAPMPPKRSAAEEDD